MLPNFGKHFYYILWEREGQLKIGGKMRGPREKLTAKGSESLSDVELLAIIISSGHQGGECS